MALTDVRCRNAKAGEKAVKLADSLGLYLFVTPNGFKSWRMKYRFGGKERRLTFGGYPEVSLTEARDRRDQARKMLRDGLDPGVAKLQRRAEQRSRSANTLREVALRWHEAQTPNWRPRYAGQVKRRLESDVFPALGALAIADVTVPLVLQVLQRIEARGAIEGAHRVRQHLNDIFTMAIAAGLIASNPAAGVRKALRPFANGKRPAVRSVSEARALLRTVDAEPAQPVTRLGSRLLALTAARPGMVRLAVPAEFEDLDGKAPIWRIPAARMKLTAERRRDVVNEFVIPLSPAAVDVVKTLMTAFPGSVLLPGVRDRTRPITDATLSKLYRTAGYTGKHVPHGWRTTFSTVMNELAAIENRVGDRDIIDLMLAHVPRDVESTYNRYAYLPRRRELALEWAALLMKGAAPAASLLEGPRKR